MQRNSHLHTVRHGTRAGFDGTEGGLGGGGLGGWSKHPQPRRGGGVEGGPPNPHLNVFSSLPDKPCPGNPSHPHTVSASRSWSRSPHGPWRGVAGPEAVEEDVPSRAGPFLATLRKRLLAGTPPHLSYPLLPNSFFKWKSINGGFRRPGKKLLTGIKLAARLEHLPSGVECPRT